MGTSLPPSANQSYAYPAATWTYFKHTRLNHHAPSIRLVRLQPSKSSDGSIQCHLRHASTASTYLCLSYVWGTEASYKWIRVNDQRFRLRQNLYDFLEQARQKPQWQSQWFWIDAICIDQSHAIERNHQVKQMGDIFAGAVQIVAWLGMHEGIVTFLKTSKVLKETAEAQQRSSRTWRQRAGIINKRKDRGVTRRNAVTFRQFCYAEYWDRAWITQEIALARHITFMAGETSLPATSISFDLDDTCNHRVAALDPRTTPELRGRSLIYLIQRFNDKRSGVARDRIFSLLSLCGDGSDVLVDYDVTDVEVAISVLGSCKRSFCLCSIGIVTSVLGVQAQLPFSVIARNSHLEYASITLPMESQAPLSYDRRGAPYVRYQRYSKTWLFTLWAGLLCESYDGKLQIYTDTLETATSILYQYENLQDGFNISPRECRISPNESSCTAIFSLPLLYRIMKFHRPLPLCCGRVINEGTTSSWPSSQPAWSLYG